MHSETAQETKGKVAVIGAGPAGLSCALNLLKEGYAVDIFELDDMVGGLSRSFEILGQRADVGPHRFFSKLDEVNDFWHQGMAESDFVVEARLSRILYNGKFFDYPLKGFDALFKLGLLESARCVLSYAYSALFPRKEPTFEAWVSNAFGTRLYEIFFKTYSERLWGLKCSELSDQFAKQRIKSLNLSNAITNAIWPQRNKEGKPLTLIDEFLYPRLGCGMVYERVAAEIERLGGHFFFKQKVIGLTTEPVTKTDAHWANNAAASTLSNRITGIVTQELSTGQGIHQSNAEVAPAACAPVTRNYDIVVSSGIFTDLVRSLPNRALQTPCAQLCYRNTILVYLAVDPAQA